MSVCLSVCVSAIFFFCKHRIKFSSFCPSIRPYVRTFMCQPVLLFSVHPSTKGPERVVKSRKGQERARKMLEIGRKASNNSRT